MIDEIGWQVRVASNAADSLYTGVENVPVTTEAHQAAVYAQLVRSSECDSSLKDLFFLPFIDETSLTGFQSGLLRADGTERPSYTAVTNAIAATGGRCTGRRVVWKHARSVLGARVFFRGLAVPKVSSRQRAWGFAVRTAEDARYVATVVPVGRADAHDDDVPVPLRPQLRAVGYAKANWTPRVRFPKRHLSPGRYVYRIVSRRRSIPAGRGSWSAGRSSSASHRGGFPPDPPPRGQSHAPDEGSGSLRGSRRPRRGSAAGSVPSPLEPAAGQRVTARRPRLPVPRAPEIGFSRRRDLPM